MRISAIYIIANRINEKMYVGSSVDAADRLAHHKYQLRAGIHCNKKLQNAFSKYGESAFVFAIIERIPEPQLRDTEHQWILLLQAVADGYNIALDTYCAARELSKKPEYKAMVSAVHSGKKISAKHREAAHSKNKARFAPIRLVSPEGLVSQISGIRRFCSENGLCYRAIKGLRAGRIHHHKGWRRVEEWTIGNRFDFDHPMSPMQRQVTSERAKMRTGERNPNYRHGKYVQAARPG